MKKIIFLVTVMFVSVTTFAQQSATDGVKQSINTMFDAMRKGDKIGRAHV